MKKCKMEFHRDLKYSGEFKTITHTINTIVFTNFKGKNSFINVISLGLHENNKKKIISDEATQYLITHKYGIHFITHEMNEKVYDFIHIPNDWIAYTHNTSSDNGKTSKLSDGIVLFDLKQLKPIFNFNLDPHTGDFILERISSELEVEYKNLIGFDIDDYSKDAENDSIYIRKILAFVEY